MEELYVPDVVFLLELVVERFDNRRSVSSLPGAGGFATAVLDRRCARLPDPKCRTWEEGRRRRGGGGDSCKFYEGHPMYTYMHMCVRACVCGACVQVVAQCRCFHIA